MYNDLEKRGKGPKMLYSPRCDWPYLSTKKNKDEVDAEKIVNICINAVTVDNNVIDVNRFSSWRKLLRVTAYVFKFVSKETVPKSTEVIVPNLLETEIKKAERYWIRQAQEGLDTIHKLEKFSPFRDENNIIRIYGRMKNMSLFDYNRKHPVLLPKNHEISKLIVNEAHNDCLHPGQGKGTG